MQLKTKLSILTSTILFSSSLMAEDFVNIQYVGYSEDSGRTTIQKPQIEINKNFGANYVANLSYIYDSVSGASPTYYDSSSGATATISSDFVLRDDIEYGNIKYGDTRQASGASLTKRFESRDELTVGINYSKEHDYISNEASIQYLAYLNKSKNSSIAIGASYQKNEILIRCGLGTDDCDSSSGASSIVKNLNVINSEIGFTQVINKTSQAKASIFFSNEDGYLSNPYMRVVRDYNSNPRIAQDKKPDKRTAYGTLLKYAKSLDSTTSFLISYRFYIDDWEIVSHTIDSELNYEISKKLTTGVGFRYYTQSKAKFYSAEKEYFTDQEYASSDRRISRFYSLNYKISGDYKMSDSFSLNVSINYYNQPDYFDAFYYNAGVKYRF